MGGSDPASQASWEELGSDSQLAAASQPGSNEGSNDASSISGSVSPSGGLEADQAEAPTRSTPSTSSPSDSCSKVCAPH